MNPLRDYQEYAVGHLLSHPRAGLFMDMGLGKTATVLRALQPDQFPVLVVAPKRVAERVWHTEAAKWRPGTRVYVATGTARQREVTLGYADRADIMVISRDNLRDIIRKWPKWDHPFKTVVLDELSSFKNRGSVRWQAAKKVVHARTGVTHVWGLTGTPAPNGYHDLWAQIGLLDGGRRCGTTLKVWRENYFTPGYTLPNGVVTRWDLRPGAQAQIDELLSDICLSMESEGRIELPGCTFNEVEIPMDRKTAQIYKAMKKDAFVNLQEYDLIGGTHTAATPASLSNSLAQITAGFMYADKDDPDSGEVVLHRNKPYAVREIVDGSSGGVLVAYRYQWEKEAIRSVLGPDAHTIDEPGVLDAWDAGNVPVLLAHPQSVGHGLNLQFGGHTAVWSTVTWSLEEWDQFNKRLDRSGQEHPVVVHTLVTPGTVDAVVATALRKKESVQDALLHYLESPV